MSDWDGRSKGNILGYKIFIFILKHVHIRVAYFVVVFVASYFYLFSKTKYIRYFYRCVLAYPKFKSEWSIFKNYLVLGKTIIDRISILAGFNTRFTYDFEGEEHLHQMAREGKGGIIIGAHAGNWEIAGYLLKRLEHTVHVVMYDGEQSNIKELLDEITGGKSFNIIFINDKDLSHIYQISEALRNGDIIAMHGDRFMKGSKTFITDFFGRKAQFPFGPIFLGAQFNVPVSFVSTMKESNTHYHFYATPPVKIEARQKDDKKRETEQLIVKYAANLEKMVQKYPLQWFNYYDFWKIN